MNICKKQLTIEVPVILFVVLLSACGESGAATREPGAATGKLGGDSKAINEKCFVVNATGETITDYNHGSSECFGTSLAIPEKINNIPILKIGINAFLPPTQGDTFKPSNPDQVKFTSTTIPSTVVEIAEQAFAFNKLTSLSIPKSVKIIGPAAFDFNDLTMVTIFATEITIKPRAFDHNDDLKHIEIHFPAGLKLEYDSFPPGFKAAFDNQKLKKKGIWKLKNATWEFTPSP